MSDLGDRLRALHVPGTPLVLPNVWDPPTARAVVEAGFPAVATSSAAVAWTLGTDDHEGMNPDDHLAVVRRIAAAVPDVPVTVDFEAGYGLPPDEIAVRLLEAGASGCNLEDTDHHGDRVLVDPDEHAARIAPVAAGGLVVNARVDTILTGAGDLQETIARARAYLEAGATCVYPIGMSDEGDIAALIEALDGAPVNILQRTGAPTNERLAELGVARISYGGGTHRRLMAAFADLLGGLSRPGS